jgi:hypothetical protein
MIGVFRHFGTFILGVLFFNFILNHQPTIHMCRRQLGKGTHYRFPLLSIAAWAADNRAIGTRKGEQLTYDNPASLLKK